MTVGDERLSARMVAEGLVPATWGNGPGDRYAAHQHAYDKVLVVARGSIVFELPESDDRMELLEGDRLDLPSGTAHAALVGPAGVTCLEAHLAAGCLDHVLRHHQGWGVRPAVAAGSGVTAPVRETARPGMA